MKNAIMPLIIGLFLGGALTMGIRDYLIPKDYPKNMMSGSEQVETGMTMSMNQMSTRIEELTQEQFDIEFTRLMIDHHQGAIDMAKLALNNSSNPKITTLATGIIKAQEEEIELMTEWLSQWSTEDATDN